MFRNKQSIRFFAMWGVVIQGFIFLMLLLGSVSQREFWVTASSGVSILVVSFLFAKITKQLFRKKRPPVKYELFVPAGKYSFPSGHATGLTSVALYILSQNVLLGLCAIVTALVIMVARVKSGVHYPVDMLGGVITAVVTFYLFMPYINTAMAPYLVSAFLK